MNDPRWLPNPQELAATRRRQGGRELGIGLLLLVIGVVVTAATYSSVQDTGGRYVIAYGPIVVGVINIFRGLYHLSG